MEYLTGNGEWQLLIEGILKESFQQALREQSKSLETAAAGSLPQIDSGPLKSTTDDRRADIDRSGRDRRFYVWGATNGYQAPLFASVQSETNIQRMIYEQTLPVIRKALGTVEFDFTIENIDGDESDNGFPEINPNKVTNRRIPLSLIELDIIFTEPINRLTIKSLSIQILLNTFPDLDTYFIDQNSTKNLPYALAGCPVLIFNYETQVFDDFGVWTGSWKDINPKVYFSEAPSKMRLRLNARHNELIFHQRDPEAPRETRKLVVITKTGLELNGSQKTQEPYGEKWLNRSESYSNRNRRVGSNRDIEIQVQIEKLDIRLGREWGPVYE